MQQKIKKAIEKIEKVSAEKPIKIVSHFDTDGITSAAIFSRVMQRWKKKFSLQIVKSLEENFIYSLPENQLLIFLDLASGSLEHLAKKKTDIIIFDHHELPTEKIPQNTLIVNPLLENHEQISSAGISYLFAKTLTEQNKDLANLAVLGMVGDIHDQNIGKTYDEIIKDSETILKKGLLIYPATRPLNKALEYSSSPYIPGVTGSYKGVLEILQEANIPKTNGRYKSLHELTEKEMSNLITAIMLRQKANLDNTSNLIGNLYLVKFNNCQEDARELSALINACSRMDHPEVALGFCLGNKTSKEKAEKIYSIYKQHLISALKEIQEAEKISGRNYTIINAKEKIKDTIIGTVASIISRSPLFEQGNIIIALAYNEDKIKVSARLAGMQGKNVREVLAKAMISIGGEVGGHSNAAGCLIQKEQEAQFITELQKVLEFDPINVKTP